MIVCESKVFRLRNGEEELVMEDVVRIEVEGEKLKLYGLLGEVKEVEGRIVLLDLIGHRVVVE